jgi:uncharacterized protein
MAGDERVLAVLGGTGRTGRPFVEQALAAGHGVRLLTRDPARAPEGVDAVAGSPDDPEALEAVTRGAGVLVNALGYDGGLDEPQDLRTRTAEAIVAALAGGGPRRVVAIGNAGVLPEGPRLRGEDGPPEYRHTFQDHLGVLRALQPSELDWTLLCPPYIPDGPPSGRARIALDAYPEGAGGSVTTGELARVTLEIALDPAAPRGRVGVAEPRD